MFLRLCILILCFPLSSHALWTLQPRYDYVGGEFDLANRLMLKTQVDAEYEVLRFYVDAFFEHDSFTEEAEIRRSESRGYLQEMFLEFKGEKFFLKIGRHSNRWSEMWTLPSLDIWTARRWNRLLVDPLPEQLMHSSGLTATYLWEGGSVDASYMAQVPKSVFPYPLPETLEPEGGSQQGYGLRLQQEILGLNSSFVVGKAAEQETLGMGLNYSFEHVVPKLEMGHQRYSGQESVPLGYELENNFVTLGLDIFFGNWLFTPQWTGYGFSSEDPENKSLVYLLAQWQNESYLFQAQIYNNLSSQDWFSSMLISYQLRDWISFAGYVQNYQGSEPGLWKTYNDITAGTVGGLRVELNGILDP